MYSHNIPKGQYNPRNSSRLAFGTGVQGPIMEFRDVTGTVAAREVEVIVVVVDGIC